MPNSMKPSLAKNIKIIIITPAWIGDFVMMQSILIAIKNKYPNSSIDVITPKFCAPLTEFMPEINKTIILDVAHGELGFKKRRNLAKSIQNKYDWAIILPITFKSALIPFFAKIKVRTGFMGELRCWLLTDAIKLNKQKIPLMVNRYLKLSHTKEIIDIKNDDASLYPKFIVKKKITNPYKNKKPILALCPGAEYGKAKKWPIKYFRKIAKLAAKKYQVWVFGSHKDKNDGDKIVKNITNAVNFAGQTKLAKSIKLLSLVDMIITNDSGLMHVGCALDKKIIAIYGSSTPEHTPPLSKKASIISTKINCKPCFEKTCKFGHYKCLTKIKPKELLQKYIMVNYINKR